jgi:outer membrane protein assembly factor BamB
MCGNRHSLRWCIALAAIGWQFSEPALAQTGDRLISAQEAARHGLRRAWYSQVQVDPAQGRIEQLTLDEDLLLVLTDQAIVHAFDANTGATRWATQIGNVNFSSLGPAANDRFVAVINGSTLYLLDRVTGTTVWQESLGGGPGGGPALSATHVFAPLISGVIKAYALDSLEEAQAPWTYPSAGRAVTQPVASDDSVFWPTDRGHLYVASAQNPQMRFRLETHDEIVAQPGYRKPIIFVGSLDGYVYAVDEISGVQQWKFSVGDPIAVSPAAIENHVFVCSQAPRIYCLSIEGGNELWRAANVDRFVAASPDRVYGMDPWSNLYILDRASGTQLGRIEFRGSTIPLVNQATDRLYLASPTGLVQCLHEIGIEEPIRYEPPPLPENLDEAGAEGTPGSADATAPTPPAQPPVPGGAADDPFGGAADDNPFGADPATAEDAGPFNQ